MSEGATFESLVTPHLGPAFGIAVSILGGDRAEAEDAVQEAALLAFRAFDTFRPGSNFRAWYFKIVTNCCLTRLRQRRRRPAQVGLDEAGDLYLFTQALRAQLPVDGADPAGAVLGAMTVEQIMDAIAELPDEYRAVATLYFVDDLSYEDIAAALGCPVGTVRSRLHRGRRLLQRSLWRLAVDAGVVRPSVGADA